MSFSETSFLPLRSSIVWIVWIVWISGHVQRMRCWNGALLSCGWSILYVSSVLLLHDSLHSLFTPVCLSVTRQGALHVLKAGPPLDLSFWSFLTFLHHGIEEVERHLLRKFYKKIRRKSWSNVPPKLVACIGFLYKVVHKIGRLRKFNRSRGI